jgi:uncharacterized membrane protein
MNKYLKESVLWVLIVLPYVYLAVIWPKLPGQVPVHFNLRGEADGWSDKNFLLILPGALGLVTYILMLVVPVLDPKKKIALMGKKYYSMRFMLTFFLSALAIYLIYISKVGNIKSPNFLTAMIGVLFALLANYFQAIRPNYFIGIRTPWALENEQIWKKTHHLSGRIWMAGGILIAVFSLFIRNNSVLVIMFFGVIAIMVLVPIIYSYNLYLKSKNGSVDVEKN